MDLDAAPTLVPVGPAVEGPTGNHGEVTCAVCSRPGWLMDMTDRGFLIRHAGTPFPCRAPR